MGKIEPDLLRDGVAYADQWLAYQQERRDLPGIAVAIRHDGETLLAKGYGFANLERREPLTPAHIFRVASHSKTFTATAVMQLVEGGRLRLDDRLADYIPWFPQQGGGLAAVTIRQALNHTTGIVRDGAASDFWQLAYPFPDADGLRRLVEAGGVILAPNESFKYSNIAYALLGLVIAAASGVTYAEYVTREIIGRLGLESTGPETDARARARLATGYTARRLGVARRPLPDVATGALAPATGFYATAEDLCRYAMAHAFGDETLLSDAAKREMQQPYWKVAQAEMHYGLGFFVQEIGERRFVGHGGGFPGHATMTLLDPRDRLAVAVFINEIGGPAGLLAQGTLKLLDFALRQEKAVGGAVDNHRRFAGRFANIWGVTDIAAFGDALVGFQPEADDPTRAVGRLAVEDDATLRITAANGFGSPGETIRYRRDDAGAVTEIVVGGSTAYPADVYRARSGG